MRVKDAPITLRRKLRTSFALPYQLLRFISICGFAAVSMAFRANSGLAFSAKHIGVALAQLLCRHRSLNRMRSTKFFEEPKNILVKVNANAALKRLLLSQPRNRTDATSMTLPHRPPPLRCSPSDGWGYDDRIVPQKMLLVPSNKELMASIMKLVPSISKLVPLIQ